MLQKLEFHNFHKWVGRHGITKGQSLGLELLRKSSPLAATGKETVMSSWKTRRQVLLFCTFNVHTVNDLSTITYATFSYESTAIIFSEISFMQG